MTKQINHSVLPSGRKNKENMAYNSDQLQIATGDIPGVRC